MRVHAAANVGSSVRSKVCCQRASRTRSVRARASAAATRARSAARQRAARRCAHGALLRAHAVTLRSRGARRAARVRFARWQKKPEMMRGPAAIRRREG